MLVIRLQRTGRRNNATFRLVLQEKSQAPKSNAKEILGSYDPHMKERGDQITINAERITYWLEHGAQPSTTVHNMLVELGVIKADKKRAVTGNKPAEETPEEEAAAPAEEKSEEKAEENSEEAAE